MEKFGIFELLDALSAIAAASADPSATAAREQKTEVPSAGEEKKEGAPKTMKTPDAAFAPPSYGGESPAIAPSSGRTAYDGFLARHESARGKVKK